MARTQRVVREVPWGWAALGAALGLVLAIALFAPARWLASTIGRVTGQQVLLDDVRGTVWNGSAQLVLTGGPGSTDAAALPGRIEWRLHPAWGGASAQVRADCCMNAPLPVRMRWRFGGMALQVGDGVSSWPATVIAGLGTPWNTLQLEGELRLVTQGLSVEWIAGRLAIAGRAELTAERVASRLSTLKPMGSYRITVQGGTPPSLQLETLEGSLQLAGSGEWVGRRLHFRGTATAAPQREAALANLLNIIGRRAGARSIISIG